MATPQWLFPFPPCSITVSIKQPFVSEPPEQLMLFDAIETTYRPGASWNVAEAPFDTLPKTVAKQFCLASIWIEVDARLANGTRAASHAAAIFVRKMRSRNAILLLNGKHEPPLVRDCPKAARYPRRAVYSGKAS